MSNEKDSNDLTPEQRYVLKIMALSLPLVVNTTTPKHRVPIIAFVVVWNSSVLQANLIRELDGQVFGNRPQRKVLKHKKI